jgi:photosystem II stability/assembly factor-like uncharacterized protein
MRVIKLTVALLLFGEMTAWALPAHFEDPLHTPAELSPLSVRTVVLAAASAGSKAVVVGPRGHVLIGVGDTSGHDAENGEPWKQVNVPVSDDLVAVSFPTAQQGWVVGHDGVVLHTADGGASWHLQLDGQRAYRTMVAFYQQRASEGDPGAAPALRYLAKIENESVAWPFLDVRFLDEHEGYVVGAFGLIMHTADGGNTWVPLIDKVENPKKFHLYAIASSGTDVYIAGEHGLLLKRDAQSGRFVAQDIPYKGSLFGVVATADHVVAFGMRGRAFISDARGEHWEGLETGTSASITGAVANGAGKLILSTQDGKLLQIDLQSRSAVSLGNVPGSIFGIGRGADGKIVLATSLGPRFFEPADPP